MARGMRGKRKVRQRKVNYQMINPKTDQGKKMHGLLNQLVAEHHGELTNARIAIAWNLAWKPDVDGRVTLGRCRKASDLDRELAPYDFIVLLQSEFWQSPTVTDEQRAALLDHELCHATVALDRVGEPKLDDRGRTVYRVRKHDVEEFSEIIGRHGCYKRDLEHFASSLFRAKQLKLPMGAKPTAAGNGKASGNGKARRPGPAPTPAPDGPPAA